MDRPRGERRRRTESAWESLPAEWPREVDAALELIRRVLGNSIDLRMHRLAVGPDGGWPLAVVYLHGLADRKVLAATVLEPLVQRQWPAPVPDRPNLSYLARRVLQVPEAAEATAPRPGIEQLLRGQTLLLSDSGIALSLGTAGGEHRQVNAPEIESTLRGPREAFVESLDVSMSVLRRHLWSPRLRFEQHHVGREWKTPVVLAYLDGVCPPALLEEVRRRLERIPAKLVTGAQPVEESLAESLWSPFPLLDKTERPDRAAAGLVEGRVLLMVGGSPDALLAPVTIWHQLQSAEDSYTPALFATFARVMRVAGTLAAFFLPALYVALTTYHHEMLPTKLALALAGTREQVPFPALVEALILELLFEALREAGLRLPIPAGQAISIVGALLLGEAAIRSNLVSPMMVIVVAVTGMASFTLPSYELAVAARLVRLGMLPLAGIMGVIGITCGAVVLLFHLTSLRSFGISYLAPLAPTPVREAGDVVIRPPASQSRQGPLRPRGNPRRISR